MGFEIELQVDPKTRVKLSSDKATFLACIFQREGYLSLLKDCLESLRRPTVPPKSLRKLRVPVSTAISLLLKLAWIAMKLVWNLWPTPISLKI